MPKGDYFWSFSRVVSVSYHDAVAPRQSPPAALQKLYWGGGVMGYLYLFIIPHCPFFPLVIPDSNNLWMLVLYLPLSILVLSYNIH